MTTEDTDQGGGDEALAWRNQVSLRILRGICFVFLGGGMLVWVAVSEGHGRTRLALAGMLMAAGVAVPAFTGWPSGSFRGWLIVVPAILMSLGGYATVGVLSGPGVCLTVTLMLAGLLLGSRAMIVLTLLSGCAVGAIGWGMVHGQLRPPNPVDVAMTNPVLWIRTLTVTFLSVVLFGALMLAIVQRIETSLRLARSETRRREQAERARAEAEIVALESKQLEMIGRLAAGVAHDFNNNLTSIMGCAELLKVDLAEQAGPRELADGILQASQRAAELTRQLLAYSRKAQMLLAPTDLHRVLDAAVSLFLRSIDPKVSVVTTLEATTSIVAADAALIESALLNLLVNARDAMPDGGKLRIRTRSVELAAGETPSGQCLLVEIADSGRGIEPELLPHIFDPFFTTKPIGRGTGLGLAAVSGTVKAHGGRIEVESTPGTGSVFRIFLPAARVEGSEPRAEGDGVVRGTGSILLVEDDVMVSRAAVATLKALGYRTTHVTDGAAALELLRSGEARFDLVMLDLRMPGMSGEQTFDALRSLDGTLKVLIWSGYGAEQDVNSMLERGAVGFVQKPYRVSELSRVIARALRD